MKLAIMTKGTHDPNCGGCPCCSEYWASVLAMKTPEYARWLAARSPRPRLATLRTNIRYITNDDVVPPPPSLADRIRAARANPRPKAILRPVAPPEHRTPRAASRSTDAVPPPPSLKAAILAARHGGVR